jgi:zinc transport system permease protein
VAEALREPFFQRVLMAALLASVACGVVGSFVVAKRITTLAGGLGHAAFGGVGLGYLLGFSPMLGAAAFAVLAGLCVGGAYRRVQSALDTWISVVWSVGMAIGVLCVALAPGFAPDLSSYLFGSLLLVPASYLAWIAAVDVGIVCGAFLLFKELQAVAFDEEFSEVIGLPVEALFLGLLAFAALAIVTVIRVVGVIMAIALLALPGAVAGQWTRSLRPMMALATALAALCSVGGLLLSWTLSERMDASIPPGPLTVLLAALMYPASSLARRARHRLAPRRPRLPSA